MVTQLLVSKFFHMVKSLQQNLQHMVIILSQWTGKENLYPFITKASKQLWNTIYYLCYQMESSHNLVFIPVLVKVLHDLFYGFRLCQFHCSIHHTFKDVEFFIDLEELEGTPGTPSFLFCFSIVYILKSRSYILLTLCMRNSIWKKKKEREREEMGNDLYAARSIPY